MTRPLLPLLALCFGVAAGSSATVHSQPPTRQPDASDWQALFVRDLSNADFPAGVWSFESGVLTATEDRCIWTKEID